MRRLQKGMTMVEVVSGMVVAAMVFGTLAATLSAAGRMGEQVSAETTQLNRSRVGLEVLSEDIRTSAGVLPQYPSVDPIFKTDRSTTLILKMNRFADDGSVIPTEYDVVIYQWNDELGAPAGTLDGDSGEIIGSGGSKLAGVGVGSSGASEAAESAPSGVQATAPLRRFVARVDSEGEGIPAIDRVVLAGVLEFGLNYTASETFFGNDYQTVFGLRTLPLDSTDGLAKEILIGSKDWNDGEYGWFDGANAQFKHPPRWGIPIEVNYGVDPTVVTDNGVNAATMVDVKVRSRVFKPNAKMKLVARESEVRLSGYIKNR